MAQVQILDNGVLRLEDDSNLVRTEGVLDDANEHTTWVEYRFPNSDVVVHRSVHVTIKEWPGAISAAVQEFGR